MLVKCIIVGVLLCYVPALGASIECDPRPKGASGMPQPVGTKFRILIATNPETYNPDQQYTGKSNSHNSFRRKLFLSISVFLSNLTG